MENYAKVNKSLTFYLVDGIWKPCKNSLKLAKNTMSVMVHRPIHSEPIYRFNSSFFIYFLYKIGLISQITVNLSAQKALKLTNKILG